MNYALILIIASNIQTAGLYATAPDCQRAAKEWQAQGVKAGCVQQESPEQAIAKMQSIMRTMMEQMPKEMK
jgi:hypothetical protein